MKNNGEKTPSAIPFVVDLDGTLVRTDLLWEGIVLFLRAYPLEIWRWYAGCFPARWPSRPGWRAGWPLIRHGFRTTNRC